MGESNLDPVDRIDAALKEWRQGDVALAERWFIHAGDPSTPLSGAASEYEQPDPGPIGLTSEVDGLVVISQTCDIVRSCGGSRPREFVEVCPLIEVDDEELQQIQKQRQPARAFIAGVQDKKLVADLDRVMTVEKSLVATWERTPGCLTDSDARDLASALGRKRDRFAFPDDFVAFTKKLQSRIKDKHNRASTEGEALCSLREIRVAASPSWNAAQVQLLFYFIKDAAAGESAAIWADHLAKWLALMPDSHRYQLDGIVTTLEEMSAYEYVHSDVLDFEHLSLSIEE